MVQFYGYDKKGDKLDLREGNGGSTVFGSRKREVDREDRSECLSGCIEVHCKPCCQHG